MRPILQRCPVGRLAAVHGNPLGSLCKPEVAGSIPVRSIKYLQSSHFFVVEMGEVAVVMDVRGAG
jgi:hypothetical protein